jgi:hypothetical protein
MDHKQTSYWYIKAAPDAVFDPMEANIAPTCDETQGT